MGVEFPGVDGGRGKSRVISSSPSLYIEVIETIEGCIDAILNLACTSSCVASPSNAASNDAKACSLLVAEDPDMVETCVANAGRGGGSGDGGVALDDGVLCAKLVVMVKAGVADACSPSPSNGSMALPLPLSSLGTGMYVESIEEFLRVLDTFEPDLDRRLGELSWAPKKGLLKLCRDSAAFLSSPKGLTISAL